MKTQMKTTCALDHISKPCVVFISLLTGHQETKEIKHKNNTSVNLIIIINQLHRQLIFFVDKNFYITIRERRSIQK